MLNGNIILLAGGDAKGADLQALAPYLARCVLHVFAFGKDASAFTDAFAATTLVDSLDSAVEKACDIAKQGDIVLLSPACASIDMFKNYMHRGEVFQQAVYRQCAVEASI
jgi:UDP-N-acetylmuramoylalanine--D-glutamate ligase